MDGQEIRRIFEFLDQCEFMVDLMPDLFGNFARIFLRAAQPGKPLQFLLRSCALAKTLLGIIVFQFIEREGQFSGQDLCFVQCRFMTGKQPRHFPRTFQMAFGRRS